MGGVTGAKTAESVKNPVSVQRFFRLLRNSQPLADNVNAIEPIEPDELEPVTEHKTGVREKPSDRPDLLPRYDRYTYHRFGSLLVQHYVTHDVLRAWCHCGNWVKVSTKDLDRGVDSCRECRMEGFLDTAVAISNDMRRRRERGEPEF